MASVSQLPLAETHQLLTVPCISDTSCQQLVGDDCLIIIINIIIKSAQTQLLYGQ